MSIIINAYKKSNSGRYLIDMHITSLISQNIDGSAYQKKVNEMKF
jgi:hypothetical protein